MKLLMLLSLLSCGISATVNAQENITFGTLKEICAYAEAHSVTFRNATQQSILAKYRTIASTLGMFNLTAPGTFTLTDNTKLSTNFIPAEVFGGPEGTFRPVTFGQKYVSNFTFEPQIDLINPYAMAQIKVSKTNEQLTAVNTLLNKKTVYESISAAYHNIRSYQWQIDVTTKSLANANTLTIILQDKQKEGMARSQDVNIAQANVLTVRDKLQQLEVQTEQQYNVLKLLCDIDPWTTIAISWEDSDVPDLEAVSATGNLLQRQGEWQTKYQQATLRADKRWMYPTLNLFSSFSWQENNNDNFFGTSQWFGTNYVGLKLSMPLFPEASKIAAVKYGRINLEMAKNNWAHAKLQDQINNDQLQLDYRKASESYQIAASVAVLRKDSYEKNLNIYREGLISATDLINSFDDWLNGSLNAAALLATVKYAKSLIIISNTIQ